MPDHVAAIVLAGGRGSRIQADVNKVYIPIRERDMLEYSLETLNRSPLVDRVLLVVREEDQVQAENLSAELGPAKLTDVVIGGATRHESEFAGLTALAPAIESGEIGMVVIHDGARPFLTLDLLEAVLQAARASGGAIPGLRLDETVFHIKDGVVHTLPGETIRKVQTPQAFEAVPLLEAYRQALDEGIEGVDTAETVERFSDLSVSVVPGDPRNIKVTVIEDFFFAEEYAGVWDKGVWTDAP